MQLTAQGAAMNGDEMKIQSREIGFDLDGVIADTAEAFIRLACEEHAFCSFTLKALPPSRLKIASTSLSAWWKGSLRPSSGIRWQPACNP
jgi:hypothetical protein